MPGNFSLGDDTVRKGPPDSGLGGSVLFPPPPEKCVPPQKERGAPGLSRGWDGQWGTVTHRSPLLGPLSPGECPSVSHAQALGILVHFCRPGPAGWARGSALDAAET